MPNFTTLPFLVNLNLKLLFLFFVYPVTYIPDAMNLLLLKYPNLDHFSGIIPCGNENSGVTSIEKIGLDISKKEIDNILISNFSKVFKIDVKLTQTLS